MQENALLSILHLSDFHFTRRRKREQEIIVEALVNDIRSLCIGHRRPDVIMFTGDLVNAGGIDRHDDAYDHLLAEVQKVTGCSDDRLFITPGNHDVSRVAVEEFHDKHTEWREKCSSMEVFNTAYENKEFDSAINKKFESFKELEDYLGGSNLKFRNSFISIYRLEAPNIDVVIVNTAVLSTGGLQAFGKDEGQLGVPEYAIIEATKQLVKGSFRIIATHHPMRMLSEASARYLRGAIEEHGHLHLFGHMHDPKAATTTSFQGQVCWSQAGAIFTHRKDRHINYSLISVDREKKFYEMHLRTYFDDRKVFDEARDIVDQGRFYSSQEARQYWRKMAVPIEETTFRSHLAKNCLNLLKEEQALKSGERDPHELFVPPPIRRTVWTTVAGDDEKKVSEENVHFDEMVAGNTNLLIYASAEFGRTTVLKELQYRLLADAENVKLPRLPIFIEFGDIKQNVSNMFKTVKARVISTPDGVDVESLLTLGYVCLLLDDVIFGDIKRMSILRDFSSQYPKVRYIIASTKGSAMRFGAIVDPEMQIKFDALELCVLRRRDMRQLVIKLGRNSDVDVVLDRLQSEFQEINLPFTAANGSILMAIYEEQSNFRPINRSVLIEQFIDTTLRKAAVEQSRRETFDYANKTALLAHVAGWMTAEDNYVPSEESVREVIKGYLARVGLYVSLTDLMSEFLSSRIFLRRSDDRLSFRYRAVLEYFIAMKMREDANFKRWVMEEERYLQFINEIQYYSGALRNDSKLVDLVGERFDELMKNLAKEIGEIDFNRIASLKLPAKGSEISANYLSNQLSAPPMSSEEKDEELQADLPRDVEDRQEVFRPKIDDDGQKLLVALFLYSGVLKNMELIDDSEKRRHLNSIWRGWSTFLHLSLSTATELARHRRIRVNGILYALRAPQGMQDAELTRVISLMMPTAVSRFVTAMLGTEKLAKQLVEPELGNYSEPLVYELLKAFLIADLRLPATSSTLINTLDHMRPSSYLREALIWKIADLRRMDRFEKGVYDKILPNVAQTLAELSGARGSSLQGEKRKQLQRLRNEGLRLKVRRGIEGD